ncbi:MAG: hypothetical protein DRO39_04640 [Thermoprotei archaeon]|nr:MAG: hypothetical protein DRO39_04640 [Thermoprotei archaeon]
MKKPLKIVAVCGMGMGTVFLIKSNVERVLSELKVPAEVIATNISSLSTGPDVDIIVASVDFEQQLKGRGTRVVLLKNILDREELKQKLMPILKELGYLS